MDRFGLYFGCKTNRSYRYFGHEGVRNQKESGMFLMVMSQNGNFDWNERGDNVMEETEYLFWGISMWSLRNGCGNKRDQFETYYHRGAFEISERKCQVNSYIYTSST